MKKPKSLGTELKSVASTSANGPIIHAEIQEGKQSMKDKCFFFLQRHFCMCPPDVKGHKKLWTETRCYCQEPFLGGLLVLEFENCCWCQRSASVRIPWCCQNITQTFPQDVPRDKDGRMAFGHSPCHGNDEEHKQVLRYWV